MDNHTQHDCRHTEKKVDMHAGHGKSSWNAAAHATLHCLTGCVIGETIGLMIGVTLGLHPYSSMLLATVLAYISNPQFWEALAFAVPAGYIAAFPVNFWLIGKEMKRCH